MACHGDVWCVQGAWKEFYTFKYVVVRQEEAGHGEGAVKVRHGATHALWARQGEGEMGCGMGLKTNTEGGARRGSGQGETGFQLCTRGRVIAATWVCGDVCWCCPSAYCCSPRFILR